MIPVALGTCRNYMANRALLPLRIRCSLKETVVRHDTSKT